MITKIVLKMDVKNLSFIPNTKINLKPSHKLISTFDLMLNEDFLIV